MSKITTFLQIITVIVVLAAKGFNGFDENDYIYLFVLTGIFTVGSGLHYMHYWFKVMGEGSDN